MAVRTKSTRSELVARFRELAASLAGRGDFGREVVLGVKARVATALLSQIQQDFILKSRGGVGKDGIKWEPLKPSTIAQRRITPGEFKGAGLDKKKNKFRGILTEEQNKRWKKLFSEALWRLQFHMGKAEAMAFAAKIAWATLKREGVKTKLELFGGRKVDILRDTGELFRSLTPGITAPYLPPDGQIFEVETPGSITVGTNKKPWHHRGIPGKLPKRALWPDNGIPDAWWPAINGAAMRGLKLAAEWAASRQEKM